MERLREVSPNKDKYAVCRDDAKNVHVQGQGYDHRNDWDVASTQAVVSR